MKLLIFTQAVDINDPVLGFFQRWLIELSTHVSHIYVVCLKKGEHTLPQNVTVYSLGKEMGESRVKYIIRFYRHLVRLRGTYDAVFVHMNPHYIILGGLYWKLKNIPIYFWRNHAKMNLMTRIAAPLSRRVFYTSPFACTARYAHAIQMPVGIDTEYFIPVQKNNTHTKKKILFLGRISPVKRVEVFIEVAHILKDSYEFHIYGDAPKKDEAYATALRNQAGEAVTFHKGVPNDRTRDIYQSHDLYINLTPDGSMDKTVLEAVASGIPTMAINRSFEGVLPPAWVPTDSSEALVRAIHSVFALSEHERESFVKKAREAVVANHSLHQLGTLLSTYILQDETKS